MNSNFRRYYLIDLMRVTGSQRILSRVRLLVTLVAKIVIHKKPKIKDAPCAKNLTISMIVIYNIQVL